MKQLETQFSRVFIHYYSNKSTSTCNLFVSEPSKTQEQAMGRLFGIFEINTPSRENGPIINEIISQVEESYYSKMDTTLNIETAFEQCLEEVNQKFNNILQEKKFYLVGNLNANTIKEKMNLTVGLIKDKDLYLSHLNNIGLYLIHKTKQDYKIIDIRKISHDEAAEPNANGNQTKLFVNVIKGELNPPDSFVLANANFLNYISLERVKKIITSLPTHKSAEYFKNSLLQFEGKNFACIIIKNASLEQPETESDSLPLKSISELNDTENSTKKLLAPSFWNTAQSILSKGFSFLKHQGLIKKSGESESKVQPETSQPETPSANGQSSNGLLSSAKNQFAQIRNKTDRQIKNLKFRLPSLSEKLHKINKFLKLKFGSLFNRLKRIPNLSKILLIVAAVLIVIFIFSTSFFKYQQTQQSLSTEFLAQVTAIEQKINQSDSDLIYGDENKAREEITAAQALLASLPMDSNKQRAEQERLNSQLESIIAKLRHITTINDLVLITDLKAQNGESTNAQDLIYQNNSLYVIDSGNNLVDKINLDSREATKVPNTLATGSLTKIRIINGQITIYHDKNGFIQLQNDKLNTLNVNLPAGSQIADFASYNNRLYTVDIKNNQIYRHQSDAQGFGAGVTWLKEAQDLKNVNSLGIDNNIWLLDSNGQVFKFTKGNKQSFELKNIDPKLQSPSKLISDDSTKYLYILEPTNKRIVVVDKDGNLVTQYYSAAFGNLKSISIVEAEKKIFVISDNNIFFFNLTHLK